MRPVTRTGIATQNKWVDGKRWPPQFIAPTLHSFAVGVRHRHDMQGWFAQIVIGIVVTVIGGLITDAVTGGHMTRHFAHGYHASSRW